MWNFIIPLSLILIAGAAGQWVKKKRNIQIGDITEDPSYDCWHQEYQDIWRKSA